MRKYLTLAIETISVFTAIGVLISSFIYSWQFDRIGVAYMSVASLSDILRDSITLLLLFSATACALATPLIFLLATPRPKARANRILFSLALTLSVSAMAIVSIYSIRVVSGFEPPPGAMWSWWIIVVVISTIMLFFIIQYLLSLPPPDFRQMVMSELKYIYISLVCLLVYPAYYASSVVADQLKDGLPMAVELGKVDSCENKRDYKTIWMGDNKAVVRCEPSKKHVVKVIK